MEKICVLQNKGVIDLPDKSKIFTMEKQSQQNDCDSGYTCQPVALLCAGDLDLVDVCCVVVRDEVVVADDGAVFVADRVCIVEGVSSALALIFNHRAHGAKVARVWNGKQIRTYVRLTVWPSGKKSRRKKL